MKRVIKIISWSLLTILIIVTSGLLSTYWWLSTKWTDFYTENEMQLMANQVSSATPLPDNFYKAYDIINPGQRGKTINQMSKSAILSLFTFKNELRQQRNCDCIIATNYLDNKVPMSYHGWSSYVTAFGLENYVSEEDCFDFVHGQVDLENYSLKYFDKKFDQLTVDECLEFVVRLRALTFYENNNDLLTKELLKHKK